ncbi:hypothetical protein BP6252_00820 [Coleophoma cylindrospora]|uniref:Uncharacterized protein n=1 Tax=Coleophoma cylindrospora TaxID=1849047 RepID=A0A3D8SSP3_9HELO|nr:hypothetical protein BP6252_00820 [Coleophoma cylindrospora]
MPNSAQHQSLRSAFLASSSPPTQLTDIATASLLPLLCDTYWDAVFYCLQSLLYSDLCAPHQLPAHHICFDKAQLAPSRTMETSILTQVTTGPGSKPNNTLPISGHQTSSRSENHLISHRQKIITSSSNNQDVEFYQTPLSDAHGSLPGGHQQPNQGSSASSSSSSGGSGSSSAADGEGAAPAAGGDGAGGDEDGEDKRAMSSSEDDEDDDDDDEEEDDDDDEDSDKDLAIEMNLGLGVLEHLPPASGITEANAPQRSSNSSKEKRKPTEGSEEVINVRPLEKKPKFVMPPASSIASRLPGFLDALRVANEELARNPEKFAMGEEIVEEKDEEAKEKKVEGGGAEGKGEEGQKTSLIEEL